MPEPLVLHVRRRQEVGRHRVQALQSKGFIPAVIYGRGQPSLSLMVANMPFQKVFQQSGESSLIDLIVDEGSPVKVLIHDIQRHPLSHNITHIDFYQVRMDEKIRTEVELFFEGTPPAVKELRGILVKNLTHVKVECLPSDLPHVLSVDISGLKTFDDQIRVADLSLPNGVQILDQPTETVVTVAPPRSEEELKALEEKVVEAVETVEVTGKPKEEAEAEAAPETEKAGKGEQTSKHEEQGKK